MFIASNYHSAGCEVLTAATKNRIFLAITLYNHMQVNRRFGGTCRLKFQGRRISQSRNQHEADSKHGSGCSFLAWLILRP
jgi:hypothetical protein